MIARPDPLLALIERYREAEASYNADPSAGIQGAKCRAMLVFYKELRAAPVATTEPGAAAAIRLLRAELDHSNDESLARSLLSAALSYFDARPPAVEVAP